MIVEYVLFDVSFTRELKDHHACGIASFFEDVGHDLESIVNMGHHLHHKMLSELLGLLKSDEATR